jgi:hypothetical protein
MSELEIGKCANVAKPVAGCLSLQWQLATANAVGYATFYSRSHNAVIRVYDATGNVLQTHEHKGEFKVFTFNA